MSAPTKGERTKQKLVTATGELLRRQGFHGTGLSDIVEQSGAPRGSLYFHFPGGKDELAVAAIEAAGTEWRARIEAAIAGATDLPGAVGAIIDVLVEDLERSKFQNGCPVAAVALETTAEPVRKAIAVHFARWEDEIVKYVASRGIPAKPAKQLATVALSAIEGALLLSRVQRSAAPLRAVGATLQLMIGTLAAPR